MPDAPDTTQAQPPIPDLMDNPAGYLTGQFKAMAADFKPVKDAAAQVWNEAWGNKPATTSAVSGVDCNKLNAGQVQRYGDKCMEQYVNASSKGPNR
ncbi:MAG: hypothetical protein V4621_05980 [Pseudomonadota bacterium]